MGMDYIRIGGRVLGVGDVQGVQSGLRKVSSLFNVARRRYLVQSTNTTPSSREEPKKISQKETNHQGCRIKKRKKRKL
jgi:hypothetical protein